MDSGAAWRLHANRVGIEIWTFAMNFEEFHSAFSELAACSGYAAPSERQLRDWIEERLIDRGAPNSEGYASGVAWVFDDRHIQQALAVAELKDMGFNRHAALRVRLFLDGRDFPEAMLKADIISEINRGTKQLWSRKAPPNAVSENDDNSKRKMDKQTERLGPLDDDFKAAGFQIDRRDLVNIAYASIFEQSSNGVSSRLLERAASMLFKIQFPKAESPNLDGLLGVQTIEGNRGISIIEKATYSELVAGRIYRNYLISVFPSIGSFLRIIGINLNPKQEFGFKKAGKSIESDGWILLLFPFFVECGKCLKLEENNPILDRAISELSKRPGMNGLSAADAGAIKPAN